MAIQADTHLGSNDALAAEAKRFVEMLPVLREQYDAEFVALIDGAVIDHDSDDERLAARLYARVGAAPFYIGWVGDSPTTYELPSPEAG